MTAWRVWFADDAEPNDWPIQREVTPLDPEDAAEVWLTDFCRDDPELSGRESVAVIVRKDDGSAAIRVTVGIEWEPTFGAWTCGRCSGKRVEPDGGPCGECVVK